MQRSVRESVLSPPGMPAASAQAIEDGAHDGELEAMLRRGRGFEAEELPGFLGQAAPAREEAHDDIARLVVQVEAPAEER